MAVSGKACSTTSKTAVPDPLEMQNLWDDPGHLQVKAEMLAKLGDRLALTDRMDNYRYCGLPERPVWRRCEPPLPKQRTGHWERHGSTARKRPFFLAADMRIRFSGPDRRSGQVSFCWYAMRCTSGCSLALVQPRISIARNINGILMHTSTSHWHAVRTPRQAVDDGNVEFGEPACNSDRAKGNTSIQPIDLTARVQVFRVDCGPSDNRCPWQRQGIKCR